MFAVTSPAVVFVVGLTILATLVWLALIAWALLRGLPAAFRRRRILQDSLWLGGIGIVVWWTFGYQAFTRPPQEPYYLTCRRNLGQVSLAMSCYEGKWRRFPSAWSTDETGQPLHSWRAAILRELDRGDIHDAVRWKDPWNSPNNVQLFEGVSQWQGKKRPLPQYWCPADRSNQGETNYMMIVGPKAISDGPNAVRADYIRDGLGNTLLVVETVNSGVLWYQPGDLHADQLNYRVNDRSSVGIGSRHGGAFAAAADRRVEFFHERTDPKVIEAAVTIRGGEEVPFYPTP